MLGGPEGGGGGGAHATTLLPISRVRSSPCRKEDALVFMKYTPEDLGVKGALRLQFILDGSDSERTHTNAP